jgi:hypothetical protein
MTVFNMETLNALGARLFDHADSITNPARHEMEVDCRLAARALELHNLAIPRRRDCRGGTDTGRSRYPA